MHKIYWEWMYCHVLLPPFLGLLYNLTESYDCAFYFAASLFLMGGAVMALPVLKFHKADPGRPIHATRSTSTIETQTFSDEDKFLTDWLHSQSFLMFHYTIYFSVRCILKYRFLFSWCKCSVILIIVYLCTLHNQTQLPWEFWYWFTPL